MKYLHVLCEGKTELNFCAKVLSPYLWQTNEIVVMPQMLLTNKKKHIQGGMISYEKAIGDIRRMLASIPLKEDIHLVTTMFDLYALPNDFPGYGDKVSVDDSAWIESIETAMAQVVDDNRFIPYIQLHEFEALVLCNIDELKKEYPKASVELDKLNQTIIKDYGGNTENVDNGFATAPSKRIMKALEGKYEYNKVKSGVMATSDFGVDNLCECCPHFKTWIEAIASRVG